MSTPRKWTVMLYMAGDNNLDSEGVADLHEIKRVGSTSQVAIVAQFDRAGRQKKTYRYHLQHRSKSSLKEDIVDTLAEVNTGRAVELTRFIRWGMKEYEADHYLVVIWAHGTGAYDEDIYYADERTLRKNLKRHGVFRPTLLDVPSKLLHVNADMRASFHAELTTIAPDDSNKDFLDNVELKDALRAVGARIDILGMDACLMSMAEVCYQIRESVDYTVASEDEQDVDGWPYGDFLSKLVENPDMSPKELAITIVDDFQAMYSEIEEAAATLSACEIRSPMHESLAKAIDTLATVMIKKFDSLEDAILLARYRCWENELVSTVDLADFCNLLRNKTNDDTVTSACSEIVDLIRGGQLIFKTAQVGEKVRYTTGLGIYFPVDDVSPLYSNLDMIKSGTTRWGEFIYKFVKQTKR